MKMPGDAKRRNTAVQENCPPAPTGASYEALTRHGEPNSPVLRQEVAMKKEKAMNQRRWKGEL